MEIIHYICPRQSGKTEFAKELQMEDPENILLYTGMWSYGGSLRGQRYKVVIMDEFLGVYSNLRETDKQKFIDWVHRDVCNSTEKLVLISTADKLRSKYLYVLASLRVQDESYRYLDAVDGTEVLRDIKEMTGLFLVENDHISIERRVFGNRFSPERKRELRSQLPYEMYLTDVEGEFLI